MHLNFIFQSVEAEYDEVKEKSTCLETATMKTTTESSNVQVNINYYLYSYYNSLI